MCRKILPRGKSVHCRGTGEKCVTKTANTFHFIVNFFTFFVFLVTFQFCFLSPDIFQSLQGFFVHFPFTPDCYIFNTSLLSKHNFQLHFHCKKKKKNWSGTTKQHRVHLEASNKNSGKINCSLTGLVGKRQLGGV